MATSFVEILKKNFRVNVGGKNVGMDILGLEKDWKGPSMEYIIHKYIYLYIRIGKIKTYNIHVGCSVRWCINQYTFTAYIGTRI